MTSNLVSMPFGICDCYFVTNPSLKPTDTSDERIDSIRLKCYANFEDM